MLNIDYIWTINERALPPLRQQLLRMAKRIAITVECINRNNIMSYASALTYSSLMAAIPILAIIFAVARGFGFGPAMEDKVRSSLQVSPDLTDKVFEFANSYLEHTKSGVFIGVGLIVLLYTLVSLTSNIETAFNTIWYVPSSRNIYRRITDYISIFLLLPFIIVISSGLNLFLMTFRSLLPDYQFVNDTVEWGVHLMPTVFVCTGLIILYMYIPNTQVKLRHAIWPGILAGLVFMGVQYFYFHYQIKLSSYNAIYGTFAAIPLFMLWLHITWMIVLTGGQLSYANQSLDKYALERNSAYLSRRYRDSLSLLLMSRICKRFANGTQPYTEHALAEDTQLPEMLVHKLLTEMVSMNLLAEMHDEKGQSIQYLPAIDIHRMTVRMVMKRMDCYGVERLTEDWQLKTSEWEQLRHLRSLGEDALLIDILDGAEANASTRPDEQDRTTETDKI